MPLSPSARVEENLLPVSKDFDVIFSFYVCECKARKGRAKVFRNEWRGRGGWWKENFR